MKNIILTTQQVVGTIMTIFLAMTASNMNGQTAPVPKWGSKAQKAIVSVVTYDQEHNMLKSGTGFYITPEGTALASYTLFDGAYSAVVVDSEGEKNNVERILGADETYSIVKFKVDVKKNANLSCAKGVASEESMVFALQYSKDKIKDCPTARVIAAATVADSAQYYTLSQPIDSTYVGCPALNSNGEVMGLVQPSMGQSGYVLGIMFADQLKIEAISSKVKTLALDKIHIKKGLPESAEEGLIYLYMKSKTMNNDEYLDLMNLFVDSHPENPEGYSRRAALMVDLQRFEDSENDMQTYLELSSDKALALSKVADIIYTKLLYQPIPTYEKWTYDVAVEYVDKAISEAPDVLDYQLLKAQILTTKKDFTGAINIYDAINNSENRSPATYYAACLAHEGLGDTIDIQIALMDSALALFPTPMPAEAAQFVLHRGQLYSKAQRYREAVIDFNQYCFLSNNKVNTAFYYDRAKLEEKARMYQQALDDYNTAISMSPETPLLYVEKCALLLKVNEINDCINTANQLLAFDEKNTDGLRIMGYAKIQKGDKAGGLADLKKAADLGDQTSKELIEKLK